MTRRTLFKRILSAAAGTVLARMPFVGPKVEAEYPRWQNKTVPFEWPSDPKEVWTFKGIPIVYNENMDDKPGVFIFSGQRAAYINERMRAALSAIEFRPPSPPGSIMNVVVRDFTS